MICLFVEGYVLRSTFSSHSQWIPSVMWSRKSEYLFVSGSYDSLVKLWDMRSLKAPLYDLQGQQIIYQINLLEIFFKKNLIFH